MLGDDVHGQVLVSGPVTRTGSASPLGAAAAGAGHVHGVSWGRTVWPRLVLTSLRPWASGSRVRDQKGGKSGSGNQAVSVPRTSQPPDWRACESFQGGWTPGEEELVRVKSRRKTKGVVLKLQRLERCEVQKAVMHLDCILVDKLL